MQFLHADSDPRASPLQRRSTWLAPLFGPQNADRHAPNPFNALHGSTRFQSPRNLAVIYAPPVITVAIHFLK